jgi:hypothetical protein
MYTILSGCAGKEKWNWKCAHQVRKMDPDETRRGIGCSEMDYYSDSDSHPDELVRGRRWVCTVTAKKLARAHFLTKSLQIKSCHNVLVFS